MGFAKGSTHPTAKTSEHLALAIKSRLEAALNSDLMIAGQAAINTGFDFRRYAMKPTPAKPMIIIAHVEGSGTADVVVRST